MEFSNLDTGKEDRASADRGNTVVFKPSSDAPLSGIRLTEAFVAAGLPKGVLNFITGSAAEIGPTITVRPEVRAISFTGSTRR